MKIWGAWTAPFVLFFYIKGKPMGGDGFGGVNEMERDSKGIELQLAEFIDSLDDEPPLIFSDTFEIRNRIHDKRKFPRKPCSIPVEYVTEKGTGRDVLTDISEGGAFVEATEFRRHFYVGQQILLNIPDAGGEGALTVPGEIARISLDGVGVRFSLSAN